MKPTATKGSTVGPLIFLESEMNLILNKSQAEAVYSAMCALTNVGGSLSGAEFAVAPAGTALTVFHHGETGIQIRKAYRGVAGTEWHNDSAAFATAYGLQQP